MDYSNEGRMAIDRNVSALSPDCLESLCTACGATTYDSDQPKLIRVVLVSCIDISAAALGKDSLPISGAQIIGLRFTLAER